MIPVARTENLLIQEVDNELLVYDQERDVCHCLNPVATRVWHYCDGQNTVEEIAKFLTEELEISADTDIRGLVWLALEELESLQLIQEYRREPIVSTPTISRRKALKRATLLGGFALGTLFPMVRSITSPALADVTSGGQQNKPDKTDSAPNLDSNPGLDIAASSISPEEAVGGATSAALAPSSIAQENICEFVPHPKGAGYNKCGSGNCTGACQEIRDANGSVQDCKCVGSGKAKA